MAELQVQHRDCRPACGGPWPAASTKLGGSRPAPYTPTLEIRSDTNRKRLHCISRDSCRNSSIILGLSSMGIVLYILERTIMEYRVCCIAKGEALRTALERKKLRTALTVLSGKRQL